MYKIYRIVDNTNNNVYILPSCITAMMTFINMDYKYFAGTNNPYDIINKYIEGSGQFELLNDMELKNNIYKSMLKDSKFFKFVTKENYKLLPCKEQLGNYLGRWWIHLSRSWKAV